MAIDLDHVCLQATEMSEPRYFFVVLVSVFAIYILADTIIAAIVIRQRVWSHR